MDLEIVPVCSEHVYVTVDAAGAPRVHPNVETVRGERLCLVVTFVPIAIALAEIAYALVTFTD